MRKSKFKLTTLSTLIFSIGLIQNIDATPLEQEPNHQNSTTLNTIYISDERMSEDEKGEAGVYSKNVANDYLSKEYLERYQINATGDVLKGLNGVYNMNTRTAGGALTPNIRGITGKGRIAVTVDGTEQTVDVWMNNYGVSDRNYVDPAFFRSIYVEKGPSLSRELKSGLGGSIAIRTIEASDVIPKGKNWGIQVRANISNNATKPKNDLNKYLGVSDYRDLNATADGAGGGISPFGGGMSPFGISIHDYTPPDQVSKSDIFKFKGDQSYHLSAAFKTDLVDGLVAYGYRNKGNYYAGKRGIEGYLNNPVYNHDSCWTAGNSAGHCLRSDTFIPNIGKIYRAGEEVFNSNTETKTWLLKNNWYLPNHQQVSAQFMRTRVRFGENNPFQMAWELGLNEHNQSEDYPARQIQNVDSTIQSDTYKLGYSWKPENNPWIDFKANLWRVHTQSERFQSGGMSLAVSMPDPFFDAWFWCTQRKQIPLNLRDSYQSCDEVLDMYGFTQTSTREDAKSIFDNENNRFKVISGADQHTKATRDGLDISNKFRFNDSLSMTLSFDYQREKLEEQNRIISQDDLFNVAGMVTSLTHLAGPRGGKRSEWGVNFLFDWQVSDRLNVQVGMRHHRFRFKDEITERERLARNPAYEVGQGNSTYKASIYVPYWELVSDKEFEDWKNIYGDEALNWQHLWSGISVAIKKEDYVDLESYKKDIAVRDYLIKWGYYQRPTYINHRKQVFKTIDSDQEVLYRLQPFVIPIKNRKLDLSVLKGSAYDDEQRFNEIVNNPQGQQGKARKYMHVDTPNWNLLDSQQGYESQIGQEKSYRSILKYYTDEQKWALPQEIKASAWSPVIAITYDLSDKQKIFMRYAQSSRFPSIYEGVGVNHEQGLIDQPLAPGFEIKPERSYHWEIGYRLNFAPYWKALRVGDIRLTYYSNKIRNVIDTTDYFQITQYDKKISKGIELQSRWDSGRFFGSLGISYRLKQQTCDEATVRNIDFRMPYELPICIDGTFGATRSYQALQPKYSINLDMGMRFFDERLELGTRAIYHSKVDNKGYDQLIQKKNGWRLFNSTGNPYHWRSSLVWDVYGRYAVQDNINLSFSINNLTNQYYLDPMSNVPTPGPGRSITFGAEVKF